MTNNKRDFKFEMKDAKREAVPPLISLWGMSGSGKTLSALYLARGIVGETGCITLIDTENGRAKFYADEVGGWKHIDMQPAFSPEKYSAAFRFCEENGADIIIVDSMSHVWEGEGGVIDMAENIGGAGLYKWNAPKLALKRMMNSVMRSSLPVIFCVRAKEAVKQVGTGKNAEIIQDGWKPIAERNFIYEMTLALRLTENGRYDLKDSKIPKNLLSAFPENKQITQEMGEKLHEWLSGGEAVDKETIKLRRDGHDYAIQGTEVYKEWFESLTKKQKHKIALYHNEWKEEAQKSDDLSNSKELSVSDEIEDYFI